MMNEGSLFITVFGHIRNLGIENEDSSGLAVDIGEGELVPIGDLTRKFITTECPTFAAKPKVWFFLDAVASANNWKKEASLIGNCNKLTRAFLRCQKAQRKG